MAKKQGITWTNERRKLSDLIPWERNPRTINNAQAERLVDSVETFGQVETLAIDCRNNILNGHQRASVLAGKHGMDYEVDVRVANRVLTERERQQLTVYLHKGAAGEWDTASLFENFDFNDLTAWGFDSDELEAMFADMQPEPPSAGADTEPQIDKAEELRVKWNVSSGQLWALGEHRLVCGDCTDPAVVARVMGGEKAGALVTDPPYGIGADKKKAHSSIRDNPAWADVNWDKRPSVDHIRYMAGFCERVAIWGGNYFADALPVSSGWLAWVKPQFGTDFSLADMELCWTSLDIGARCREFNRRDGHEHPTQKPVDLIAWTMEKIGYDGDGVIVDLYSGSGTTIIACQNLGRKCRAVEISPAYVAVAIERFFQHTNIEPVLISE